MSTIEMPYASIMGFPITGQVIRMTTSDFQLRLDTLQKYNLVSMAFYLGKQLHIYPVCLT